MNKKLKSLPHFNSEDEEREFWATYSSEDYVDFDKLVKIPSPEIPKTTNTILLTLPDERYALIEHQAIEKKVTTEKLVQEILALSFKNNSGGRLNAG